MVKEERRLFGTDGIRGRAHVYPLVKQVIFKLGQVVGEKVRAESPATPLCILGKDTRESSDGIERILGRGLSHAGIKVMSGGILPTPAVAYLVRNSPACLGVVISASHNPYTDNGIKFFNEEGYKFDDAWEVDIEKKLLALEDQELDREISQERIPSNYEGKQRYIQYVRDVVGSGISLEGMKVVIDAANGSAYETSKAILESLGADCHSFHVSPDGRNINQQCGSTYKDEISRLVRETEATVGIAHDGDADRVLLCDEKGEVLDGDEFMAIAASYMIEKDLLKHRTLVTTVMSNLGLDQFIEKHGGKVERTNVGDRYVIEAMREGNYNLGGEQSGHFIFHDYTTTGDGIISALYMLRIVIEKGETLHELKKTFFKFPQVQRNVDVASKFPLHELKKVNKLIAATEKTLGSRGRVLLRYSGTEPKIRLLLEGEDEDYIHACTEEIVQALHEEVGMHRGA